MWLLIQGAIQDQYFEKMQFTSRGELREAS